ncbi:MAG: hypothetical protein FGM24_00080 [Candidatus Kapabacteria bacterium]|nr:hypothetical protein [Candidatus Kapabacteria bacterium]
MIIATGCASVRQELPNTDVYLADFDAAAGSVRNVRNITARPGYDNQASFAEGDSMVYFVSDRTGGTDVYRYEPATGMTTRVTFTPDQEFSPTAMTDGRSFSAIRVRKPDASDEAYTNSQQLWRYELSGRPVAPVNGLNRIGYHCWLGGNTVAMFIVGDDDAKRPHTLVLYDLVSRITSTIASNIGRSLQHMPDGRLSFVDKSDTTSWMLSAVGASGSGIAPLVTMPKGSEDVCWLPDGMALTTEGADILGWKPPMKTWRIVASIPSANGPVSRLRTDATGKRIVFSVLEPTQGR